MKYRVAMVQTASTMVEVEAEDVDDAIDKAWQEAPGGLCAQCSGWGHGPGIDLAGDWEPSEVFDDQNNQVWNERDE